MAVCDPYLPCHVQACYGSVAVCVRHVKRLRINNTTYTWILPFTSAASTPQHRAHADNANENTRQVNADADANTRGLCISIAAPHQDLAQHYADTVRDVFKRLSGWLRWGSQAGKAGEVDKADKAGGVDTAGKVGKAGKADRVDKAGKAGEVDKAAAAGTLLHQRSVGPRLEDEGGRWLFPGGGAFELAAATMLDDMLETERGSTRGTGLPDQEARSFGLDSPGLGRAVKVVSNALLSIPAHLFQNATQHRSNRAWLLDVLPQLRRKHRSGHHDFGINLINDSTAAALEPMDAFVAEPLWDKYMCLQHAIDTLVTILRTDQPVYNTI